MIEDLKSDEIINKLGGRFKLTALIQRRLVQLMHGDRPLVNPKGLTPMEVVIKEILQEKIQSSEPPPEEPEDEFLI